MAVILLLACVASDWAFNERKQEMDKTGIVHRQGDYVMTVEVTLCPYYHGRSCRPAVLCPG